MDDYIDRLYFDHQQQHHRSEPMIRTHVYLTQHQRDALRDLSCRTGRSRSALIREAIDAMIERQPTGDWKAALRQARGMWKDRDDLPDFAAMRRGADRFPVRDRT